MPHFLAVIWLLDPNELNEQELWEHYEECLRAFDWTYQASNDAEVWHIGQQQEDHLTQVRNRCSALDPTRAYKLYYRYSFYHNDDGSLAYPVG